jgi:signal transduction histidine kinase
MQSLLFNLIENALKFHRKNVPPIVKVSAFPIDEHSYEIIVSDNGIGIKTEHVAKIFEIFGRLHGNDIYPGTGVGLALCKKIAERHGGRIQVDSQEGVGSTFRVKLPFQHSGVVTSEEIHKVL